MAVAAIVVTLHSHARSKITIRDIERPWTFDVSRAGHDGADTTFVLPIQLLEIVGPWNGRLLPGCGISVCGLVRHRYVFIHDLDIGLSGHQVLQPGLGDVEGRDV